MHSHYMPQALLRSLQRRKEAPCVAESEGKLLIEYGPHSRVTLGPALSDSDLLIQRMDEVGIDHSILSVTIPGVDWFGDDPSLADACNRETADLCRRHPKRISGLATVPLNYPDNAAAVLSRAVEMGLKGAMIYSNVAGGRLDAPAYRSFFQAAAELDVPLLLHPTYPLCAESVAAHGMIEMAGFLFDTTTAALSLIFDGLYERHPNFKLIVPHGGSLIPYFVGRIDHFRRVRAESFGTQSALASTHIRKLFIDTACQWPPALRLAVDFFGIERVMLGTDYPFLSMSAAIETIDSLELGEADRAKIRHENAVQLFGLNTALTDATDEPHWSLDVSKMP